MTADPTPSGAALPFRVVSWNVNHWQQRVRPTDTRAAAWAHMADNLKADVGLLQETVPPRSFDERRVVYREIAGYRPWGSAVAAFRQDAQIREIWSVRTPYSRRRFTLANTVPGAVAVAEVTVEGIAPLTFVSVYNVTDDVYYQTTLLRIIADLIPLLDSAQGSRVVLAGDLNMSLTTQDPYYLRRGRGILGALESLGLAEATALTTNRPSGRPDCPCGAKGGCAHIATFKGRELDHIYLSDALKDQVVGVSVDETVVGQLSDHAPLILDLALTSEPVPRTWDRDTFADEVGRRNGAQARAVVEALYGWAESKEIALRERGVRDVVLTRFPTSKGASPELWFQIDYHGTVPALMYSISIRASGEVVVQFLWMRQPPFDSPERREPLRQAFNRIPGVEIGEDRRNGKPTFPIDRLYQPGAIEQLMGVLDMIVNETDPGRSIEEDMAGEAS